MGSGGVTIVVLSSVICLKVLFSDGLGGGNILYDFNKVKLQNVINLYSRGITSFATSLFRSLVFAMA